MTKQERKELAILQVADVMENACDVLNAGQDVMQTAYAMTASVDGMRQRMSENGIQERYEYVAWEVYSAINNLLGIMNDIRKMRKD